MAPEPARLLGVMDVLDRHNVLQPFAYAALNPTSFLDPDGWEPIQNYTISPRVGAYDVFTGSNFGAESSFVARSLLSLVNNVNNLCAYGFNAAVNAYETGRDAVAAVTGVSKAEMDLVPVAGGVAGAVKVVRGLERTAGAAARKAGEALKDFSGVATRTTRGGGPGVRLTRPDGSVIDITAKRVKEFVPNTHPSAPPRNASASDVPRCPTRDEGTQTRSNTR